MKSQAEATGCSVVTLNKDGGNDLFYEYFTQRGFAPRGENIVLDLPSSQMNDYDLSIIPTENDKLSFWELFFLREHGFDIEDRFCRFDSADKSIVIDRESGSCTFSAGISVSANRDFILHDAHSLSQIHICRELLKMGITEDIEIIFPETKVTETTPDVLAGKWGIFLSRGRRKV